MSRKKVTKSRVKKSTRPSSRSAEAMEKDCRAISNKLPELFRKEAVALKKQEEKLQASLLKLQKQQVSAKNKQTALENKAKAKPSSALKKQLTSSKKAYDALAQAYMQLAAQLEQTKARRNILSQKQSKFTALCKYIYTLDKEWDNKATKEKGLPPKKRAKKNSTTYSKPAIEKPEPNIISSEAEANQDLVVDSIG